MHEQLSWVAQKYGNLPCMWSSDAWLQSDYTRRHFGFGERTWDRLTNGGCVVPQLIKRSFVIHKFRLIMTWLISIAKAQFNVMFWRPTESILASRKKALKGSECLEKSIIWRYTYLIELSLHQHNHHHMFFHSCFSSCCRPAARIYHLYGPWHTYLWWRFLLLRCFLHAMTYKIQIRNGV